MHVARAVLIPTPGLIGAPLLVISSVATLVGGWEQVSSTGMLFALPIAAWGFSVGVYKVVKGFRGPVIDRIDTDDRPRVPAPPAVLANV